MIVPSLKIYIYIYKLLFIINSLKKLIIIELFKAEGFKNV